MEKSIKKDAMGKLKTLAEDIGVCMMVTGWGNLPFCAVPMTTKKVDGDGNSWFLSLEYGKGSTVLPCKRASQNV